MSKNVLITVFVFSVSCQAMDNYSGEMRIKLVSAAEFEAGRAARLAEIEKERVAEGLKKAMDFCEFHELKAKGLWRDEQINPSTPVHKNLLFQKHIAEGEANEG